MNIPQITVTDSDIEQRKLLLEKSTCYCCHEFLLESAKQLPTCKHVYCFGCIQSFDVDQQYNKQSQRPDHSVRVICPRCFVSNELPEGNAEMLKDDSVTAELMSKLKKDCQIGSKLNQLDCKHVPVLGTDASLSCFHCGGQFCDLCFVKHNDSLRKEIHWAVSGFEDRLSLLASAGYDKDSRKQQIELQIQQREKEFVETVDQFEKDFLRALGDYRQRSLANFRKIADVALPDFTLITMLSAQLKGENSLDDLSSRDLAEKYSKVLDADQKIYDIEQSPEQPVPVPSIAHSHDILFKKILETIENISAEVKPTSKEQKLSEALRLKEACQNGNIQEVRSLLERETIPASCRSFMASQTVDDSGNTLLKLAAERGRFEIARYLVLEHHVHFDDALKYTEAIKTSAESGYLNITEFLIDAARHDAEKCSNFGLEIAQTVCVRACKKRRYSLVEPFRSALAKNHFEIARYLLKELDTNQEKLHIDELDQAGYNLLHHAVINDNREGVEFLVREAGANLSARTKQGLTALELAKAAAMPKMGQFLEELAITVKAMSKKKSNFLFVKLQRAKSSAPNA